MSVATDFGIFKGQWLGKYIDYDGAYGYQCVDLVKQYLHQNFGLSPGAWGNAINYWNATAPAILSKFIKVPSSAAQVGDVVIFYGLAGNPNGHIGIATGNEDGVNVEVLEQNGHTGSGTEVAGNEIRTRFIARSRVAGILRPIASGPAPHNETVKPGTWNVRSRPGTNNSVIGIVHGGQVYNTVIAAGNWRQINYGGHVGYVGPAAW